jgi:RNA methyltransferase, TrmH family
MKRIASRDNPTFRALRKLVRDAGTVRDGGQVLLEGLHLGDAFLASGGTPLGVFVGESALDDAEVAALLGRIGPAPCHALADALFPSISGLAEALPLLMVVARPRPEPPARMTRTSVLIDRVQDPGNVGSILRSAAAAGIADVYLSSGTAGAWSPKVVRAAMGAHFRLRLFEGCDLAALRRDDALPWIATSPHAERSLFDADLRGEVAWIFGHEGRGVDPALTDPAFAVRIPQPGAIESLNVAASAAICLFEQVRQRGSS